MDVRKEWWQRCQPGDSGNDLNERIQDSNEKVAKEHKFFISALYN